MAMLYLVRHALTRQDPARNMAEWELDPAGAGELARLAALPHWAGAGAIFSSSEPKARLTAEAIRAAHGLPPVEAFDELREIRKAGWVGDRHDQVMADLFANPERPPLPGWETAAEAGARFARGVERVLATSSAEPVVLVAHATVLSIYLAALLGQERVQYEDWRSIGFPDYAVVDTQARRIVQPFGAWLQ